MNRLDYNQRYRDGYMSGFDDLYEGTRVIAVRDMLKSRSFFDVPPSLVVDIACGQGRYVPITMQAFPNCRIIGIDIAIDGLKIAKNRHPEQRYAVASSDAVPLSENTIDMIISIETLEHVSDVQETISEWARILKPGGKILMTTPCANKFSLEWLMMFFTGGLQSSEDGIGRFRSDEPGHLRRLTSNNLDTFFKKSGLKIIKARFRSHFFSTLAATFQPRRFRKSRKLRHLLILFASLDWYLFRLFPNAASMVFIGQKDIQLD